VMPDRAMGTVPDVPADGTLVRELGSAQVFLIEGGLKRAVAADAGAKVQVTPDGALASINSR